MDGLDFSGRVAIVTGADDPADRVVMEIRDAGGTACANYASVATRAGADSIVDTAMNNFGRVDILINNAGNQRNKRFEDMTDADFASVPKLSFHCLFPDDRPASMDS